MRMRDTTPTCERWQRFENFFADMGVRPSPRHRAVLMDPNGIYEPGNVQWVDARWATRAFAPTSASNKEQAMQRLDALTAQVEALKKQLAEKSDED